MIPKTRIAFPVLPALLLAGLLSACTPNLSPLYRDYEVPPVAEVESDLYEDLRAAFQDAGWELAPATTPNTIATETKTLNHWGLYRVVVSLEAAPLGDGYVRLYIHPYRIYFTGSRSKIPYLRGSIARAILPKLNDAFEARDLVLVGTAVERDRVATRR